MNNAPSLQVICVSLQTWYDTSFADWQVQKEGQSLILNLNWKRSKLIQTWRFSLKENYLVWQVDSKLDHPFNLDVFKFGLFLLPEYKTFFCGHQQQDFPGKFSFWKDMPLENQKAGLFGLRKQADLPAIVLEGSQELTRIIQNSDARNSCRILQLSLPKESLLQKEVTMSMQ
ncbi:MAG: hypothetical protein NTZ83_02615, partial [Candidatus Pacearchaeota archaeon]|nr:hypothetical protein [Candidatus Pacearchaeota archaeon]